MRGVSSICSIAAAKDLDITICHCFDLPALLRIESGRPDTLQGESEWRKYNEDRFRPYMDEAVQRLQDAGIEAGRITSDFLFAKGKTIQKLITTAVVDNYGTIVVGRRENAGLNLRRLRRHFSEEFIRSINDAAVWVVS